MWCKINLFHEISDMFANVVELAEEHIVDIIMLEPTSKALLLGLVRGLYFGSKTSVKRPCSGKKVVVASYDGCERYQAPSRSCLSGTHQVFIQEIA